MFNLSARYLIPNDFPARAGRRLALSGWANSTVLNMIDFAY